MDSLLDLRQLSHQYGSFVALRDVNLQIAPGPIGLVGQNGAGKSTLMQILLGLIRPTQGTATVLGYDVCRGGVELRGRVGFMPERNALIPGMHGIKYVALAGEMCGMPRRQALRRAHETLSHLGMEDARYRPLDDYSLGMTQRIKLAATLVHDPDLLLLDEPTSGLDPEGRAAMLNLLATLAARPGKSLILATHLLGDIERVCGTTIILHQGQVVRVGRLEELREVRQRCYRLSCEVDPLPLAQALYARGLVVERGRTPLMIRVRVSADWNNRDFFVLAQESQVPLSGLELEEEDLEAVYHRLVGGSNLPPVIQPMIGAANALS
ncbi:MAG: ABC transporter ATP-binding protein [Planctomycetota bacterium]